MTFVNSLVVAVLYAAVTLGANPVFADEMNVEALKEMRVGDMRKLVFHKEPREAVFTAFLDKDENEMNISGYEGKIVLLNFWATWCAPCRKEMPSLDALQKDLGGDRFEVVTVATGRNPVPMIEKFFEQVGVTSLPILRDPSQAYARNMGILGLPMTVLLNEEGEEIARLRGEAEWHSPEAVSLLQAVIRAPESES